MKEMKFFVFKYYGNRHGFTSFLKESGSEDFWDSNQTNIETGIVTTGSDLVQGNNMERESIRTLSQC